MTCECTLCRDDREAAKAWQARAAELRAEADDCDLRAGLALADVNHLDLRAEADDYDARAARTLERINSYPSKP